jgi:hypothetical protein
MGRQARRQGVVAVHSVDRFVFSVPRIDEAQKFYSAFGLDARSAGDRLDLYTYGHPHCWASIYGDGRPKKMQYIAYCIYEDDADRFRRRIRDRELECDPQPLSDGSGLWLRDPDGTPTQLVVGPKVSPSVKSAVVATSASLPGTGSAPARSKAKAVRPRRLSHVLRFTPDVERMLRFHEEILGLRLSDRAADLAAFLHTPHGSDHHLVAFAKSEAPGLHHSSWDVASIDEVGWGAECMRSAGYEKGWGVGRHVIGSNYFYYAGDPWGSFAEYSFNIDYIPADRDWKSGNYPPEDSLYLWGPAMPDYFVQNQEARRHS